LRGVSCVPVSLRDHALRSSVEDFADFSGVAKHGDFISRSELDEPDSRLPLANKQASEILPTGEPEPVIEGAPENSGQHVSELETERIAGVLKRPLFGQKQFRIDAYSVIRLSDFGATGGYQLCQGGVQR
jgi:hypothetical protein